MTSFIVGEKTAQPVVELSAPGGGEPNKSNRFINRELWLTAAMAGLNTYVFKPAGYVVPENTRISCSWPSRGGMARKKIVLSQSWDALCSTDGSFEIFISPRIDDPEKLLAILAENLIAVVVGIKHGRRKPFKDCALAIGLEGPMRTPVAGETFKRSVAPILEALGPYPHGAVNPLDGIARDPSGNPIDNGDPLTTGDKPQKGRLIKLQCPKCDLTLRLARKWIDGKRLSCPNMDCPGHEKPIHDYRAFKQTLPVPAKV